MPQVQSGEVLIKSEFCGICGTDLHAPQLSGFRPPVVMGHEFAGEIVEVGPNVKSWWQGQRVAVNPNGNVCGKCESCRGGRYNTCHKAILEQSLGAQRDGGMANFVSVPTAHLHVLPDEVDLCSAAWSEPLAVAVRAVRNSEVRFGDSVCVIGGGPIGLLVVQLARRAGASSIVLVEPSKLRREAGSAVGADLLFEPEELARSRRGRQPSSSRSRLRMLRTSTGSPDGDRRRCAGWDHQTRRCLTGTSAVLCNECTGEGNPRVHQLPLYGRL